MILINKHNGETLQGEATSWSCCYDEHKDETHLWYENFLLCTLHGKASVETCETVFKENWFISSEGKLDDSLRETIIEVLLNDIKCSIKEELTLETDKLLEKVILGRDFISLTKTSDEELLKKYEELLETQAQSEIKVDSKKDATCVYCSEPNEPTHFICQICGDGMCDDCYNQDIEHTDCYSVEDGAMGESGYFCIDCLNKKEKLEQ